MTNKITQTLIGGTGSLPKDLSLNSKVLFSASGLGGSYFSWLILSKPKNSSATLTSPNIQSTLLTGIDAYGVYLVRLILDDNKTYYSSVSVPDPKDAGHAVAPEPVFDFGNGIKNFSFEIPGVFAGYAADWTVNDEEGLLDDNGGITRGRIIATNFNTGSGEYCMCLGDDLGIKANFKAWHEFSVSQDVDFSSASKLKINIKFIKR